VYLFGHSAGGGHALRLANADGGPWRAAATHAGASRPWDARPRPEAPPLRLYAGALDVTVPPDAVRAAAEALAQSGHRVELVTIPRHDHWYYAIGPRLARDAWSFLSSQ
jgi:predicted esterase